MIKNYILTALRYFTRNKITTLINMLGLSIGISAALVIFMMVHYQKSFDRFEPDNNRIYRVVSVSEDWKSRGIPVPLTNALKNRVSGIESVAALFDYNDWNTKVIIPDGSSKRDKLFKKQDKIAFTDSNYFRIIPHQWLAGNPKTALNHPYQLVLTKSRAETYFPGVSTEKIMGRTVILSDTLKAVVTGVVADLKDNSDFKQHCFISLSTVYNTSLKSSYNIDQWQNINSANQIIVKLKPLVSPSNISNQIAGIIQAQDKNIKTRQKLQPLADIHLDYEYNGKGGLDFIKNLILLAVFLLALGAINFINLSTAHASERAKEIGIRKTLGSGKGQLLTQFLLEIFLLTAITALVSTALVPLSLKVFSNYFPAELDAGYLFTNPAVWLFLILLVIGVSLIAGLYPAFVLSAFKPVAVLKNKNTASSGNAWLRKALIISQFVVAQVFVIGVLVINKQIRFAQAQNMGFRKEAVINFYVPFDLTNPTDKKQLLKQKLSAIPDIQAVSLGNQSPAFAGMMTTEVNYQEKGKDIKLQVASRNGDTSYLSVYKIPILAGRNITASDTINELLINQTLANQIGFDQPTDAVGHFLKFNGNKIPIVGVMNDFHQASMRLAVSPLIYFSAPQRGYVMHVALQQSPETWKKAIKKIEAAWKIVYPDADFDYSFLDKTVENFYKQDRELSTLLTWSAGVAILISCLGMLGLVIFMTNKRTKEIGVRKVLGASVSQIMALLAAEFAKLLALAFIIALPIAWWQTHQWLQNFAYHTALSWWVFLLGGIVMISIALIIVGIRAGKAAMVNPVRSLRSE